MPYPDKKTNEADQAVEPVFISVARYAALMGISPAQARRDVHRGLVIHIRNGDRILIPADEPARQLAEARTEFMQRQPNDDERAM